MRNRIMMSPMCQYSATDGLTDDWHFAHPRRGRWAATASSAWRRLHVELRGRITKHCLGLWNDAQRDRLTRIAAFVSAQGAVPAMLLNDPYWPLHAANALKAKNVCWPVQYERANIFDLVTEARSRLLSQQIVNGAMLGSVYAMVAVALT
jgi:2,4-dienoyl-CoA reductase-like NADH-dependent reductase (Old Yellow Enzyme family)